MRKEITIYFKNKKVRNIIIASFIFLIVFILVNGIIIYISNPANYYFYAVKKVIPYPAFTVGSKMVTISQYEDLVSVNKRIYENTYRVDFSQTNEGLKNLQTLRETTKKEMIERVIMENILDGIGQSVNNQDIKKEYDKILNEVGGDKEIGNILKYSSNIKESDVQERIYENLLRDKTKENFIFNLKMKVVVIKPNDIGKAEDWETAKKKIDEISDDLKADTTKFNQYYSLYNDKNDFIVQNFGKEYYFAEDLPSNFSDSFYAFTPNMISKPIKGELGYYIFKIEDKKGIYKVTLDEFLNDQKAKIKIRYFLR